MRPLNRFSAADWLQLLPLQHAFKQVRNDALLALYTRRSTPALAAFIERARSLENRNIAIVIAFERPKALQWLLEMAARHLTDATVLVFDNSRQALARLEIEQICLAHGTPYLALPANPTGHANRSHGMAMQWIFENVVRKIRPARFAFIDHDLIPVAKTALARAIGDQPFGGLLHVSDLGCAWQLWAGYCVFDYKTVGPLPLNFLYDFSLGLDTGGRSWPVLYRHYDRNQLRFSTSETINIRIPSTGETRPVNVVDGAWLHMGGIGYDDNWALKAEFFEHIAHAIEQGATLRDLTETGKG
jgi:hypothetical protein